MKKHSRLPWWLVKKIPRTQNAFTTREILKSHKLRTVCESARCPNMWECFSRKRATFMILGNVCTRNCLFCSVKHGSPEGVDRQEPLRIADAVKKLELKHVVITSVTRDDLCDGGAGHFAAVIKQIRENCPDVVIEVLTPDFKGKSGSLDKILEVNPDIFNHNLETVSRLHRKIKPQADYLTSLKVLKYVKKCDHTVYTKSGIMVGLGENFEEVENIFDDLKEHGCDILTVGQYLRPSESNLEVKEYILPEQFKRFEELARLKGFKYVQAGPFVRSSYNADRLVS
ncbi:MAG: lipoyl synthase [Candidatus Aureabacteria bacterium]|nr:lipoyl synthase [Candidatus Auribacterota bacterium]